MEARHTDQISGQAPSRRRAAWLAALLVVSLAVCSFAAAIRGPFILDDWPLIANNRSVHALGNFREWFTRDFWNVDVAQAQLADRLRYFRPLVLASYALDLRVGGRATWVLHATNLSLHALVSLLALFTLRRWTGTMAAACLGALLFALHPTKAESVAWISGRPDLFLTLGVLIGSLGVARRLRRQPGGLSLELLGAGIAYLSKEHAVVLPALACVECWVAGGRRALDRRELLGMLRAALPQLCLALIYLGARAALLPLRQFEIRGLSWSAHAALVAETLGRLHALALWPADLTTLQSMVRTTSDGPRVDVAYAALGVCFTLLAAGGAVTLRRRCPPLSVALGLWLGMLLPVCNIVWSGLATLVSPRFLYLPSLALAWFAAELGARARGVRYRLLPTLAGVLVFACAARAALRSAEFGSATAFWNAELQQDPALIEGHLFAMDRAQRRGRPRQALQLAAHAWNASSAFYSHSPARAVLILEAVELALVLTPDAQRAELLQIDAFAAALLGPDAATLRVAGIQIDVPRDAAVREKLRARRPRLSLLRADIATRLGDDARALELAGHALAQCPRCSAEWEYGGRIALRAGDQKLARAWLAGAHGGEWTKVPSRLRRLADAVQDLEMQIERARGAPRVGLELRRYLMLGLAGRAYAVVVEHAQAISSSGPEGASLLAEVAARAGAEDNARTLLANLPAGEVERRLASWRSAAAGDAPLTEADDPEFEATLARLLSAPSG